MIGACGTSRPRFYDSGAVRVKPYKSFAVKLQQDDVLSCLWADDFMKNFEEVRVCLFDPARHNLMVTRASLVEIGFSKIQMVTDFAKFSECVAKQTFDLVIAESHDAGGGVGDLMRKIRVGEVGANPFVVCVTTSWDRESVHLRSLVNSGIDDILLRPFSTEQLRKRLKSLVANRKEFVVTSDYVGPDRRGDEVRNSEHVKSFDPPNTLKVAALGGELDQLDIGQQIISMQADVAQERIRRLAMKVVVAMQVFLDDPVAGEALDMEEIDATARELRRRLRGHGAPDAVELASALTEITTDILDPAEQSPRQFKLVRELALGTYTAFAGGDEMDVDTNEVQSTVASLRNKLQKQLISGWQSA